MPGRTGANGANGANGSSGAGSKEQSQDEDDAFHVPSEEEMASRLPKTKTVLEVQQGMHTVLAFDVKPVKSRSRSLGREMLAYVDATSNAKNFKVRTAVTTTPLTSVDVHCVSDLARLTLSSGWGT